MAQALSKSDVSLKDQKLLNFHSKLETLCIKAQSRCLRYLIAAVDFPFRDHHGNITWQ